jgi:hypothetical protein
VAVGGGFHLTCSATEGAVLILPDGACREDLSDKKVFYDQAMEHGISWYEYANITRRRMAENGSLYLVTGTDKTTSWGITAFSSTSGGREVFVKLMAAQVASGSFSRSHQWEISSPATVRTGSSAVDLQQNLGHNQQSTSMLSAARAVLGGVLAMVSPPHSPVNQCVFTRGYCISLRDGLFDSLITGHEVSLADEVDPEAVLHHSKSSMKHIPFNAQSRWSLRRKNDRASLGHSAGTSVDVSPRAEAQEDVDVDKMPIYKGVCPQICLHLGCELKFLCTRYTTPPRLSISGSLTLFVTHQYCCWRV